MVRQNKQTKIKNNYFLIWEKNKRILYSRGYQMTISNKINDNCSLKSSDSNSVLKDVVAVKAETVTDYIINKESYEIGQNQIVPNFIVYLKKYAELRPVNIDTSVDNNLKKNYNEYDVDDIDFKNLISYNEDERDKNLYVKKKTYLIKDKIDEKYFNDDNYEETINPEEKIEGFSNLNVNINKNNNNKNKNFKYDIKKSSILLITLVLIIVVLYIVNTKLLK